MSESDKIKTFFKRALGVVSTFKDTPWYNETNGRQRNIVEAKDINIEQTPEIPEWSDSSLNSTTMTALGFDLIDSDFAPSDSSFTSLHTISYDLVVTWPNHPDPGSTNGSVTYDYSGVLQPIDTTTTLSFFDRTATTKTLLPWSSNRRYMSNLSDLGVNFETAVATFTMNTNNQLDSSVTISNNCRVFAVINEDWDTIDEYGNTDVDMSEWTLLGHDNEVKSTYIQSIRYVHVYTRDFTPGTYDFDDHYAFYIFQPIYPTYKIDGTKFPGMYLHDSVMSDSSGTVALFVRLKLDKMEGTELTNLDASAIVYTKHDYTKNEKRTSSPVVSWDGSNLSLIDTTTPLTEGNGSKWNNENNYYGDGLSDYVDLSTAVATTDINTYGTGSNHSFNTVVLYQTTEVFMLRRSVWNNDYTVSTDGWSLIATDNAFIPFFNNNDMNLYRRVYQPGTYSFDNGSAMYIFQRVSGNSLMDSAYEFNYNSQLNVSGGIEVFKPYNYTLEYSSDESTFTTVEHSDGNWIFDHETGFITFEDDPSIDLSNGSLYFTFVKYVGVQGLDNLLCYKNGKIGIANKDPQSELDVSGSVNITGHLDIDNNLTIDTSTLFVDSTNSRVGINKLDPSSALDVSGDVTISESLTITTGVGIGGGFCPIGSIVMWPTNSFDNSNLFGEWHLCDGTDLNSNDYPDLSNIIGSSSNLITLPDFTNRFVKGAKSGEIAITSGGSNTASFDFNINHIPNHAHNVSTHSHDVSGSDSHSHETVAHQHDLSGDDTHVHETQPHQHNITDDTGHSHTFNSHTHNINSSHTHEISAHQHGYDGTHRHNYNYPDISSNIWVAGLNAGKQSNRNIAGPYNNFSRDTTNTGSANAASNLSSANTTDVTSGQSNDLGLTIHDETLALSYSSSGIFIEDSGNRNTNSATASTLQASIDISSTILGQTNTFQTDISGTINIDNHQITTNNNGTTSSVTVNCVVNPLYHSLFFYIRIA